jgi:hypothetical protein
MVLKDKSHFHSDNQTHVFHIPSFQLSHLGCIQLPFVLLENSALYSDTLLINIAPQNAYYPYTLRIYKE